MQFTFSNFHLILFCICIFLKISSNIVADFFTMQTEVLSRPFIVVCYRDLNICCLVPTELLYHSTSFWELTLEIPAIVGCEIFNPFLLSITHFLDKCLILIRKRLFSYIQENSNLLLVVKSSFVYKCHKVTREYGRENKHVKETKMADEAVNGFCFNALYKRLNTESIMIKT